MRCGSSSCLVSTAAVGQQFVDREEGEGHCNVSTCTGAAREKIHEYGLQQQSNSVQQVESW